MKKIFLKLFFSYPLISGSLFSASLLILSFPPFDLFLLAWIAFIPLLWGIYKSKSLLSTWFAGWVTGTLFFYGTCWWISHSMIYYGDFSPILAHIVTIIIASILGFFTGIFSLCFSIVVKRKMLIGFLFAPFFWTMSEYLRSKTAGMGWNAIGYSQASHPILIQSARIASVYGIGFLLVGFSSLMLYAFLDRRQMKWIFPVVALVICGILIDGKISIQKVNRLTNETDIDVIAVQPVTPILIKNDQQYSEALRRHIDLSKTGLEKSTNPLKLVVWPESQMNFEINEHQNSLGSKVLDLIKNYHTNLLFNGSESTAQGFFNVAAVVNPLGKISSKYQKTHLIAFGEYVPFRSILSRIGFTPLAIDAHPALEPQVNYVENYKVGTTICFESSFPELTRDLRNQGARAFVNIANDGWFGLTPGSLQHLRHLPFRAIETQCETIRVTNSGISARISPTGKILETSSLFLPEVYNWKLGIRDKSILLTFYAIYGDVFAIGSGIISLIVLSFLFYIKPVSNLK